MNTQKISAQPSKFSRMIRQIHPGVVILPTIALLLSAVMTWANVGLGDLFLAQWGRSFITSLVILPMILVCIGALDNLVNTVFASMHWVGRKLVVSLLTAFTIESVLALAVTAINSPWNSTFGPAWWIAFSRSIPVGVLIGLFMSFYMKPKMDQMTKAVGSARA
jgi:Protein of unknown function (DUF2798)